MKIAEEIQNYTNENYEIPKHQPITESPFAKIDEELEDLKRRVAALEKVAVHLSVFNVF